MSSKQRASIEPSNPYVFLLPYLLPCLLFTLMHKYCTCMHSMCAWVYLKNISSSFLNSTSVAYLLVCSLLSIQAFVVKMMTASPTSVAPLGWFVFTNRSRWFATPSPKRSLMPFRPSSTGWWTLRKSSVALCPTFTMQLFQA